ncbi:probable receptor-like protein kinase At2g42960 isoform X1 [Helianthus annuus]|uniref:probable receptor-like protein kinase At2g42960 isoform X1 n=1 Tax=Helianthus annuus TaxID=4232 RepID=UPI001652DFCD|nr:probable receptor-like protein kinase At2g42960 isoform X1 [Helianthus annuus]
MTLEAIDHNHNNNHNHNHDHDHDHDHEGVERKIVLVGIGFDECGRELLDWAMVEVAEKGDRVIAVNVCRNSEYVAKYERLLDDYLADFEGICEHKQVDLTGQVLTGNSVRKVLVREAKFYSAASVVVGISKIKAFGCCLSIAKYCAKKLPLATQVLALHDGKVVFKRFSNGLLSGSMRDPRPSFYLIENSHLKDTQSEFCESEASDMGRHSSEWVRSSKDEDVTPFESRKKALSSVSVALEDFAHQRPGWPLLRANTVLTPSALEAKKMSVVKWVMNLPNRAAPAGTPQARTPSSSSSDISLKSSESDLRSECSMFTDTSNESDTPKSHELSEIFNILHKTNSSRCQWIGFDVLKASTSDFASENLIGKGGYHDVYKGIFPDGKSAAVKFRKASREAWKDYILEIDIMTSLDHKNITPLLGVCVEDDNLISVYDLVPRGNLEDNLHGVMKDKSVLSWETRLNIAIGVAEALNYLHKECPRPVLHRDIKSSNILLSDEFEPQLSDFGLAIWGPTTSPFLSHGDVVGTFGYLAPEYFMYGKVSEKIDVYSFGVVLLELLTRKRPISSDPVKGEDSLVMWAKPKLEKGDLASVLDVDLDKEVHKDQIARMAQAATLCLTRSARRRPTMSQVIRILRGEHDLDERVTKNDLVVSCNNEEDDDDDEVYPESNAESHLSLVFLDIEDKSTSVGSVDVNRYGHRSLQGYLRGRWS